MTASETKDACVCGHDKEAHEHFRSGTECSLCPDHGCEKYRPATGLRGLLRRLFGR